ncbi:MAG: type II toxin-antitoxin system VapC family toxin [Acidimicrobiia bacterium]|nr:type II toxin-antitoxin system VapC family toxin [Acidimicrobiia bacterium]
MTAAVLDACAGIDLVLRRPAGECVQEELESAAGLVFVPELFDLEVLLALRKLVLRRAMPAARAERAAQRLKTFPATRVPHRHLFEGIWSRRADMTVYDSAYAAVAELVKGRIVTTDTKFAGTPGLDVAVVTC